jgi:hypothetical protein
MNRSALAALLTLTTLLVACTLARDGSTIVRLDSSATNGAPVYVNAAANGANAQHADRGAENGARGSGALSFASRWWVWLLVGIVLVAAGWLAWKFIFTGARLALLP